MEKWELKQMQGLPLEIKIEKTKKRIKEWYNFWNGDVYVSFSGGKDSTVLLNIVRSIYPDVKAVFVDTGLEFPEIRTFVKTIDNVVWIKPKLNFKDVIEKYGYPVVSKEVSQAIYEIRNTNSSIVRKKRLNGDKNGNFKLSKKWRFLIDAPFNISHKCCYHLKKSPVFKYERKYKEKPFIGTIADESLCRETVYLKKGCNSFTGRPTSTPLGFWTEQDILRYLINIPYSDIYGKIITINDKLYTSNYNRTGCMFCMFGLHFEKKPNRFEKMKITHPLIYNYCLKELGLNRILNFLTGDENRS